MALLVSCRSPQVASADITVSILSDGQSRNVTVPAGSTVTQALQSAGITVGNLDRIDPPAYTVLS
ncbi:ubiquitin-like domain-containing protein, partial [Salmonella sp. SAL4433]|uniref:ubiquitin-like domain-containing protein n=1 Tax=Salmonella sp. SAL4433 TaxID=3159888 RepID=UPI00397B18D3